MCTLWVTLAQGRVNKKDIQLLHTLTQTRLTETQFAQIVGRMRLYQALPSYQQRRVPKLLITDSQINEYCNCLTSVNIKDIAAWCKIDIDYESGAGGHYESNPLYYANNLYLNGEKVTELVIPNSVTCIRGATFYGCTSLTSVTFGNNLTRIEQAAFRYCSGLTSIEIPNTMSNIEKYTFSDCSGLTSVMIPNNITSIGDFAFEY